MSTQNQNPEAATPAPNIPHSEPFDKLTHRLVSAPNHPNPQSACHGEGCRSRAIPNPQSKRRPSPAQCRANALNALRSTGPRSPEGKARASRNARKHGLCARDVVLTDGRDPEDPVEFDQCLRELRQAYQPVGLIQAGLVQRIADCTWRLRRANQFELRGIAASMDHWHAAADQAAPADQAAAARAEFDRRILEVRAQIGDARAYLDCIRRDREFDPLDQHLTFDLEPVVTEIAQNAGRALPEFIVAENCVDDYAQFLSEIGIKSDGEVRAAFFAALQRLLQRHEERLAHLEAFVTAPPRLGCPTPMGWGTESGCAPGTDGLGVLPSADRLKLLIRYETMLTRTRDRAVAELTRLQAVGVPAPSAEVGQRGEDAATEPERPEPECPTPFGEPVEPQEPAERPVEFPDFVEFPESVECIRTDDEPIAPEPVSSVLPSEIPNPESQAAPFRTKARRRRRSATRKADDPNRPRSWAAVRKAVRAVYGLDLEPDYFGPHDKSPQGPSISAESFCPGVPPQPPAAQSFMDSTRYDSLPMAPPAPEYGRAERATEINEAGHVAAAASEAGLATAKRSEAGRADSDDQPDRPRRVKSIFSERTQFFERPIQPPSKVRPQPPPAEAR